MAPTTAAAARAVDILHPLHKGPYPVGFEMRFEIDASRPALPPRSGMGRQVPMAVWYPARASRGSLLRIRDYVLANDQALVGPSRTSEQQAAQAFRDAAHSRGVDVGRLEPFLDKRMLARRRAPHAEGRFPLVLFAHAGVDTASVTAEYLASYGYVVAAIRSRAATEVAYRLNRANLDAMVADHDFAASRLQTESYVDSSPPGVIGMSNGSIAAVALQLRRPIGAVVSLDGGIGENAGGTFLRERTDGDVLRLAAPILHLYTTNNPHLNLEHLASYRSSPRTLVGIRGMRHQDFLAYPAFDQALPGFSGNDVSCDAHSGFVWVNRYTLHFLDAHLRNTRHGGEFLAAHPETAGAPTGLLAIERLAGPTGRTF